MPVGLETFDENGVVTFRATDRLARVLGSTHIYSNGSLNHSGFATGTPWVVFVPHTSAVTGFNTNTFPSYGVSGTTLSWSYPSASTTSGFLLFGVY